MTDPQIIGTVEPETGTSGVPQEPTATPPARRTPRCAPTDAHDATTEILRRIQADRGRRLFALIATSSMIDDTLLDEIRSWRTELRAVARDGGFDVLLHSPGGVLTSCYQVARLFASCCDSWDALVPAWATSGATLISLGSAKLIMGDSAIIGPIDPQVSSKRSEKLFDAERQSPLEAFEAMVYLRRFALESVSANWRYFVQQLRIAPKPALEAATNLAFHLVQPVISRIEPYDLGAFALDSRLSRQYCERVGNPPNSNHVTQRKVKFEALVEGYAAHEFAIDPEEAAALGYDLEEPSPAVNEAFEDLRTHLDNSVESYIGLVPMAEAS